MTKKDVNTVQRVIRISPKLDDSLMREAFNLNISTGDLMRKYIEAGIKSDGKDLKNENKILRDVLLDIEYRIMEEQDAGNIVKDVRRVLNKLGETRSLLS